MKPDWKDAPEWSNWLAMDPNGLWCWYEYEPEWESPIDEIPGSGEWCLTDETLDGGRWLRSPDGPDCDGIDWDLAYDTLEKRP